LAGEDGEDHKAAECEDDIGGDQRDGEEDILPEEAQAGKAQGECRVSEAHGREHAADFGGAVEGDDRKAGKEREEEIEIARWIAFDRVFEEAGLLGNDNDPDDNSGHGGPGEVKRHRQMLPAAGKAKLSVAIPTIGVAI